MRNEISVDRHKVEENEKNFVRENLKGNPDESLSKNEALYKKCKRRADNLNELKGEDGNNIFPKMTATKYIDYFKVLVMNENLKIFNRYFKEDFTSLLYHFIINKGYELPLSFEVLINNYSLNADAANIISEVKELFFGNYYKALKEIRDLVETEYIDYYEYYLSLVKKNGGKERDECCKNK
jgi:hypothetical protein